MTNNYYEELLKFKHKVLEYTQNAFRYYRNELELKLEDYNLLSADNNCIETSTSIGFILEEFIVSKLNNFTAALPKSINDYYIERLPNTVATIASSYDCFSYLNDSILGLINIKVCKNGANNNAVAAINQLYKDYTALRSTKKCFMVLKIHYDFIGKAELRKINILNIEAYYLEEIDFSKEKHHQDSRNWSKKFDANSGRLVISDAFRKRNQMEHKYISYETTLKQLYDIINANKSASN